jgi:hypothetical protein
MAFCRSFNFDSTAGLTKSCFSGTRRRSMFSP